MRKRLTQLEFETRVIAKHGNSYDLSNTTYKGSTVKVSVICLEHGEFYINPSELIRGKGCEKCGRERTILANTKTNKQFVKDATGVHGNTYDYSKSNYTHSRHPVKIICSVHGTFEQRPTHHLKGCGCPKCGIQKIRDYRTGRQPTQGKEQ